MPKLERWALVEGNETWSDLTFRSGQSAIDFARTFYGNAGAKQIHDRGIRVVPVTIEWEKE